MQKQEIIDAVNRTFIETLEIPAEKLRPEARIFEDLGLDSLDMVDLMVGLQRRFGISLRQNEEMKKIRTLADVYSFLEKMESQLKSQGVNTAAKLEEIKKDQSK